jgi:hypothetical protein
VSLDEDEILAGALGSAAARRLKKSVLEVEVVLAIPPAAAAERARQVLGELGSELDRRDEGETPDSQVVAIVPAGAGGLNPAVVTVTIRPADSGGSKLVVRGAAKEGLIKQRAGEAAARRVAIALAG